LKLYVFVLREPIEGDLIGIGTRHVKMRIEKVNEKKQHDKINRVIHKLLWEC